MAKATRSDTAECRKSKKHDPNKGHGYVLALLKGDSVLPGFESKVFKVGCDAIESIAQDIRKAKIKGVTVTVSLMERLPRASMRPGNQVVVSCETGDTHGSDAAHDKVQQVARIVDDNANVQHGLSQHWCCYGDMDS